MFHKAAHDSLTGISNSSIFYDRLRKVLTRASRKFEHFGIISLDMDGDVAITKPFDFEGVNINLCASIGYALFSEDGIEIDILIEQADKSMYEAKHARKGAVNVR